MHSVIDHQRRRDVRPYLWTSLSRRKHDFRSMRAQWYRMYIKIDDKIFCVSDGPVPIRPRVRMSSIPHHTEGNQRRSP